MFEQTAAAAVNPGAANALIAQAFVRMGVDENLLRVPKIAHGPRHLVCRSLTKPTTDQARRGRISTIQVS